MARYAILRTIQLVGLKYLRYALFFLIMSVLSFPSLEAEDTVWYEESAPQLNLTMVERGWLSEHSTLRVAGPRGFPPFQYITDENTVGGMVSDYLQLLSERLGVNMEMQTDLMWPDVLQGAKDHTLDLISCAAKTAERETYLRFTSPVFSFPIIIVGRNDAPFIGGLKDLSGKKVAVIKGVSTYEWLQQDNIEVTPHIVNTPLEALQAVSVGKAEAHVINLAAASYLIEKHGLANLKVAAPTEYGNYDLHMAVRDDWPELVTILNKAFASITQEEHDRIRQQWIAVRYEYRFDPVYLRKIGLQAGTGFAVVLLLVFLWNKNYMIRSLFAFKKKTCSYL